ncbi:MAG: hypothetical protein IJU52_04280 [Clostridia bacterium]|nr:hypothetical protein [Clostridia bacterium]
MDDFINYINDYNSGAEWTHPQDTLKFNYNSGTMLSDERCASLGSNAERAFAGTIIIPRQGVTVFEQTDRPLFNYVTTDLKIRDFDNQPNTLSIKRVGGESTGGALFANHVIVKEGSAAANWSIEIDSASTATYEGLIGDIAASANVTVEFTNNATVNAVGSGNIGLICGTLNSGATLNVTTVAGSGSTTVQSTAGNAGGLVGEMKRGSTLTLSSANNSCVGAVISGGGYAGGIVGKVDQATVTPAVTDYAVSGTVTGSMGAGGLFGSYKTKTGETSFTLEDTYAIGAGLTIDGNGNTGGVFGMLETVESFEFDGNNETVNVNVTGGSYRGGVCGKYLASQLADTFEIKKTVTSVNSSITNCTSGGLIGVVTDSPAYIRIHDVSCTSRSGALSGGLIGSIGKGGTFVDATGGTNGITVSTDSGTLDAGLIGSMPEGVLRMQGTFDLSGFVQNSASSGYLVKNRDHALVYALGDGKGTTGNWTFKRNNDARVDDIHSWGEVIRADGSKLSETDLFTVEMSAHTVTVKAAETTMNTLTKFAKTALNMKLNNTTGTSTGVGALKFTSGDANRSATLAAPAGTLTLGDDIDLSGTGLLGMQRDDGKNPAFSGTFDGGSHTITFATGENYGTTANGSALNGAQGNIYQHTHNGLFAITKNATVKDVTLVGTYKMRPTAKDLCTGCVTAYATNSLTLDHVNVSVSLGVTASNVENVRYGGAVGEASGDGLNISVSDCDLEPEYSDSSSASGNAVLFGGAIAVVNADEGASPAQSVSFSGSTLGITLSRTSSIDRLSCFGGAIARVANCIYVKDNRQIDFSNVDVNVNVTNANTKNREIGGILGMNWFAADVMLDDVNIDSTITVAGGGNADFGGLVREATGHWDVEDIAVTKADYTIPTSYSGSSFGFVANKTFVNGTGDAQSALYLDVDNAEYDIGALNFVTGPTFTVFDEIVADSRFDGQDIVGQDIVANGHSVISITTADNAVAGLVNTSGATYNTYLNKTTYGQNAEDAHKINPNTRYYYNLKYAREHTATEKFRFLVFSANTYAHTSIANWFDYGDIRTFTGDLDMRGLSYYPIDLKSDVTFSNANVVLDNVLMENNVKYAYGNGSMVGGRTTRSNTNQHYLMHTALFRNNPASTISVTGGNGLKIAGNVPRLSDSFCGFLVAGTMGTSDTYTARLNASKILFDVIDTADAPHIVTNTGEDLTDTSYAPLLINRIEKNTSIDIRDAEQSTTGYSAYAGGGKYAASSLIGDVGSATARGIYLKFAGLKFDGRSTAASIGNLDTAYGTYRSIFSRATILNSFLYAGESRGTYNYEVGEDWGDPANPTPVHHVTYGKEITNSSAEFYNDQYRYYPTEGLATRYETNPVSLGSSYDFSSFLPHVYVSYDLPNKKHEIAVNVSFESAIEGCGKYNDPYIITSGDDLNIIANIINGVDVGASNVLYFPFNIDSLNQVKTSLDYNYTSMNYKKLAYKCTNDGDTNFASDPSKTVYLYNGTSTLVNNSPTLSKASARQWLAGAYYVLSSSENITLPSTFKGLGLTDAEGSTQYAFRGVLIGRGGVKIVNQSDKPLIHTSLGSVIQNIKVSVETDKEGAHTIDLVAPGGSNAFQYTGGVQSYGALIGQILGGDNIIDNVEVSFASNVGFKITEDTASNYERLNPIGGYVGALVNGGLIFRNMTYVDAEDGNTVKTFPGLTASTSSTVVHSDSTTTTFAAVVADSGHLYVNPYIGRVIAGYAFYETTAYHSTEETSTMKNGTKNYSISDLSTSGGKLKITNSSGQLTIEVPDGQAMYVLGAIVNSGAGAADIYNDANFEYDKLTLFWQAYRKDTTTRANSLYSTVGSSEADEYSDASGDYLKACKDYYATSENNTVNSIPHVISEYTTSYDSGSDTPIEKYYARSISKQTNSIIKITGDCDVAAGFRGIGSIYLDNDNVRLRIQKMGGDNGSGTATNRTITLNMRFLEYDPTITSYKAVQDAAGFGLFNVLLMNNASSSNSIYNLTLSGSVFYDIINITNGSSSLYKFLITGNDGIGEVTVLNVGGIAGCVYAVKNSDGKTYKNVYKYYLKNITMNGLSVEGAKYAGGLIGYTAWGTGTSTIENCGTDTTNGISVIAGASAGGLIGYLRSYVEIKGNNSTKTTLLIDSIQSKGQYTGDTSINNYASDDRHAVKWVYNYMFYSAGGIIGLVLPQGTTVSKVQDYIIKGKGTGNTDHVFSITKDNTNAGGVVGVIKNRRFTIQNVEVENLNVSATNAGGIIGEVFSDKAITNNDTLTIVLNNVTLDGKKNGSGKESNSSINGYLSAGGYIGCMYNASDNNGGGKITLETGEIKNYNISSTTVGDKGYQAAGGFIGYSNPGSNTNAYLTASIHNLLVDSCAISNLATGTKATNGTGGLFGRASRSKIDGYNVMIRSTSVTSTTADVRTSSVIGNYDAGSVSWIKLVGVHVDLDSPTTDETISRAVGYNSAQSATSVDNYNTNDYIVFADFSGLQTNETFSGLMADPEHPDVVSTFPFVTANPSITIPGNVLLTGDGVSYTVAGLPIKDIMNSISESGGTYSGRYGYAANAYYNNGSSGNKNYQKVNDFLNSKFAMFSTKATGYYEEIDFPVLVWDSAGSHDMLNSYIRMLTNTTGSKFDYKTNQNKVFSIHVMNVAYANGAFTVGGTPSLKYTNGSGFSITNSAFDNGKAQFSLVDVRYYDPADTSATPAVAYHLYIPVFVEKVLSFNFDIATQSGTTYLSSEYTSRFGKALIENVGMPVTTYFRYSYDRTTAEWEDALESGETVNFNYTKKLLLSKQSEDHLPADTVLVLIDPNRGGKPYYATFGTARVGSTLDLGRFKETMTYSGGTYTFSGESFTPVDLEDMMDLTVTQNSKGKFMTCDAENATVVVDGQGYCPVSGSPSQKYNITVGNTPVEEYYISIYSESDHVESSAGGDYVQKTPAAGEGFRPATDAELADDTVKKYVVSTGGVVYEYRSGTYVKDTTDVEITVSEYYALATPADSALTHYTYSDLLFHYYILQTMEMLTEEGHPPAKIIYSEDHPLSNASAHLIMGKIFEHEMKKTSTVDSPINGVMTEANNTLNIDLCAQFGLSEDLSNELKANLRGKFNDTDIKVFQSFVVSLNKREQGAESKAIIGTPLVSGNYYIDTTLDETASGSPTAYTSGNNISWRASGNFVEFVTTDLSASFSYGAPFEINADVSVVYDVDGSVPAQFPGQSEDPDSPFAHDGVTVSASSNIAFQQSATTYSKNTESSDDVTTRIYHTATEPVQAKLNLIPLGDKVGDFTPLGINALNNGSANEALFDLLASLNVTGLEERIADYTTMKVTITLEQKYEGGTYGSLKKWSGSADVSADIDEFLTCRFEGGSVLTASADGSHYETVLSRTADLGNSGGPEIDLPMLHCTVVTGAALESAGQYYANYRITISVVLSNVDGVEYAISRASNFVVYTNAKIIPNFVTPVTSP